MVVDGCDVAIYSVWIPAGYRLLRTSGVVMDCVVTCYSQVDHNAIVENMHR